MQPNDPHLPVFLRIASGWRLGVVGLVAVAALSSSSCVVERLFPDPVGAAVGRLSVRNVAVLLAALNANDRCGLGSAQAKSNAVTVGEVGRVGTYTLTVENCELDFPTVRGVTESCQGQVNAVAGKAVVSAVQTVEGLLTADPSNPVVPLDPEGAVVQLVAKFDNFEVLASGASNSMRIVEGGLSVDIHPRLAVADGLGVCSKIGSNLALKNLSYDTGSLLHITNGDQQFDVPVDASNISAQIGQFRDVENFIDGTVRVWDVDVNVPEAHENHELDPDYDREAFVATFGCMDDLRLPLSYECDDLTPTFGQGAAQLAIRDFAGVMAAIEADTRCGFSSPAVLESATLLGDLGRKGGGAVFTIDGTCELSFSAPYVVSENCLGIGTTIQGVARVRGTKTLTGIRTGALTNPVVPTSQDPAEFDLDIEFVNFVSKSTASEQSLLIRDGKMRGRAQPRTAMDLTLGACSIVSPNIEFIGITISEADVLLRNNGVTIAMDVDGSNLNAVNGIKGDRVNYLEGEITVDGTTVHIPSGNIGTTLDPGYNPETFVDSYSCLENIYIPQSDDECSFNRTLAEGAARLIVQSVGTVAGLINSDGECGFADLLGQIQPSEVVGDPGEMGLMRWDVTGCAIGTSSLEEYARDCIGGKTYLQGHATVNASRIVRGEREKILVAVDSIKPTSPHSVDVVLDQVLLEEFSSYSVAPNRTAPAGELRIQTGLLDAIVHPALGEMRSDPGRFMVPTPVAKMEAVRLQNAQTSLHTQGMTFFLDIDDAYLSATNGTVDGITNQLEGYIVINGTRVDIAPIALNPSFDREQFDQSYACTDDLAAVLSN